MTQRDRDGTQGRRHVGRGGREAEERGHRGLMRGEGGMAVVSLPSVCLPV